MMCFHHKQALLEAVLEEHLIQPKQGLPAIYQQLHSYASNANSIITKATVGNLKEPLRSYLLEHQHKLTTMAIDLPIYLASDKPGAQTLMVCAMDPLPPIPTSDFWKGKTIQFNNDIGFWAPFSLIDDWSCPFGSMRSNLPFFKTLLTEYNLYVTDIYKLFFRLEQSGYQNSNALPEYTEMISDRGVSFHGEILAKEIELVNPVAILTLGNASRNKLLALSNNLHSMEQVPIKWGNQLQHYQWNATLPILSSPHISGAANGAKAALLANPRYRDMSGAYQNERLAHIVLSHLH